MATVIDALFFELGVRDAGLARGLNQARQTLHMGVRNIAASLAAPLTAALASIGSGAFVADWIQQSFQIDKLSEQLGVNSEELQAWSNAAERAGGSAASFQSALRAIKNQVNSFSTLGNLEGARLFSMLGLPRGGDPMEIMRTLAARAGSMNRHQFEDWAKKLGLDDDTIYFLRQGREEIEKLIKRQKELGFFTKEDAEISRRARIAFLDLGQALKVFGGMIARDGVPWLEKFTNGFTDVVIELRQHQPFVEAFLAGLALSFAAVGAKAALAAWPILLVAGVIAGFALVWDDFKTHTEGGVAALEKFWRWLENLEPRFLAFSRSLKKSMLGGVDDAKKTWLAMQNVAEPFFSWLDSKIDIFSGLIEPWVTAINKLYDLVWRLMPDEVKAVFEHNKNFDYSGNIEDYIQLDNYNKQTLQENIPLSQTVNTTNNTSANNTVTTTTHIDNINVNGVQDGKAFAHDLTQGLNVTPSGHNFLSAFGGVRR